MRGLIVKLSSLGDLIHTLPALTDLRNAQPDLHFDWVVEEAFKEVPMWHPAVANVIPIALRRLKKHPWATRQEILPFCHGLRAQKYDVIIDAQGLIKSGLISLLAHGPVIGFDKHSAREPWASLCYQKCYAVPRNLHAVTRLRHLFAQHWGYVVDDNNINYGITANFSVRKNADEKPYLVFLHGTTWDTKHWPEAYWFELACLATAQGFIVKIPWGNAAEHERAEKIARASNEVIVLAKSSLTTLAQEIAGATSCVAVDTGLGHLAAALNIPTVSLYGPTDPHLTGALGQNQLHIEGKLSCAPCLQTLCMQPDHAAVQPPCLAMVTPEKVMEKLIVMSTSLSTACPNTAKVVSSP